MVSGSQKEERKRKNAEKSGAAPESDESAAKKVKADEAEAKAAAEAEAEAKAEEAKTPEERFKDLLVASGVANNVSWQEAVPLIINDPRYHLLKKASERKAVFKTYIEDAGGTFVDLKDVKDTLDPQVELRKILKHHIKFMLAATGDGSTAPTPEQLADLLRTIVSELAPVLRDAPTQMADWFAKGFENFVQWDVATNSAMGEEPPAAGALLEWLDTAYNQVSP